MRPPLSSLLRTRAFLLAAIFATLWLGALALAVLFSGGAQTAAHRGEAAGHDQAPGPSEGSTPREDEVVYGYDVYDERLVVGLSENVFLGLVLREAGHESIPTSIPGRPGPAQTQFSVEVLRSVKSGGPRPLSVGQDALVSQYGGPNPETGRPIRVVGYSCGRHIQAMPLEPGRRYLFATVHRPQGPFHLIVVQPTGALPVQGPPGPVLAAYERARRDQTTQTASDWGPQCD